MTTNLLEVFRNTHKRHGPFENRSRDARALRDRGDRAVCARLHDEHACAREGFRRGGGLRARPGRHELHSSGTPDSQSGRYAHAHVQGGLRRTLPFPLSVDSHVALDLVHDVDVRLARTNVEGVRVAVEKRPRRVCPLSHDFLLVFFTVCFVYFVVVLLPYQIIIN